MLATQQSSNDGATFVDTSVRADALLGLNLRPVRKGVALLERPRVQACDFRNGSAPGFASTRRGTPGLVGFYPGTPVHTPEVSDLRSNKLLPWMALGLSATPFEDNVEPSPLTSTTTSLGPHSTTLGLRQKPRFALNKGTTLRAQAGFRPVFGPFHHKVSDQRTAFGHVPGRALRPLARTQVLF